ncbi:MAG: glycerophosphodiester phosphodiesterase family protein [Planctomycetota bacterium]
MAPLVVAHRGNSSVAPENTLAAVGSAVALDPAPEFVEVDVHRTADHHLVVLHDKTLERTCDRSGRVAELDLSTVRLASAGYAERFGGRFTDERVPLLEEVLDAVADSGVGVMIEVKAADIGAEVAHLVTQRDEADRHVIASFRPDVIAEAKAAAPTIRTLYLAEEYGEITLDALRQTDADILGLSHRAVTPSAVARARASGLELWCWTVNDLALAAALQAWGVDAIITDRPADVMGLVRAAR